MSMPATSAQPPFMPYPPLTTQQNYSVTPHHLYRGQQWMAGSHMPIYSTPQTTSIQVLPGMSPIQAPHSGPALHAVTNAQYAPGRIGDGPHLPNVIQRGESGNRVGRIQDAIKTLSSRGAKYSGDWDEDLMGIIEVYEMTAEMFALSPSEKLQALHTILDGSALSFFTSYIFRRVATYQEAIQYLCNAFTSQQQPNRLPTEWRDAKLSAWYRKYPEKSQIEVFNLMFNRLRQIQRQLHYQYHHDMFLRDQLVSCVSDMPQISQALRQQFPPSSVTAKEKIGSMLSSEPMSAGNAVDSTNESYYGLGKRFGGQAQRRFPRRRYKGPKESKRRRLARVKGCWVCGADHRAADYHSPPEIEKALEKHTKTGAYVLAEEVFDIMFAGEDSPDSENWTSDDEDATENADQANFALMEEEVADVNRHLEQELANYSFLHAYTACNDNRRSKYYYENAENMRKMDRAIATTDRNQEFNGIIVDTGANRVSMISLSQYKAYCREYGVPAELHKDCKHVRGIGAQQRSFGSTTLSIPFPNFGFISEITFFVFESNVPTLLSLRDLKQTGIDLSIQNDCLLYDGASQPLVHENDFLIYRWTTDIALYTYAELLKLHRSFGHPTVSAFYKLLKTARPEEMNPELRGCLENLVARCKVCTKHGQKPRRFKLTIGTEDGKFNAVIAIDILKLGKKPVLHIVDESTHYNAGSFLKQATAKDVWRTFMRCWVHTYAGPPDFLRIDQGSNLIAREFMDSATTAGIKVLEAPVESPATMTHVERYHAPLRSTFEKLKASLPKEPDEEILQMALHCVHSTVGPEGLCPNLCVFGIIPRPARNTPSPTQVERAKAIDEAIKGLEKEQAKRKVSFGLKYRGPYRNEQSDLDGLQFGAPVRVYRPLTGTNRSRGTWEGPFQFVFKDGETVCVQLPHGRRIFRSSAVRPDHSTGSTEESNCNYTEPSNCHSDPSHETPATACSETNSQDTDTLCTIPAQVLKDVFGDCNVVKTAPSEQHTFKESRNAELVGLQAEGVFEIGDEAYVPKGNRIYETRWVDVLKPLKAGGHMEKSRLVARNFRDAQSTNIPTKAPTISRMGQRLALCIAAMRRNGSIFTRDVTQAYTQSQSKLERPVYLRPPPEMNLPPGKVLILLRPLYGVPESGLHWFLTYRDHHVVTLSMSATSADHCLFYKRDSNDPVPSVIALQVDDSLGSGTPSFLSEEELASKAFKTKPRHILSVAESCTFNGNTVTHVADGIVLITQCDKISELRHVKDSTSAVSMRAKLQYISTSSRPDLSSATQLLCHDVANSAQDTVKALNKLVDYAKDTANRGIQFVRLDPSELRVVLFTDSSFANVPDGSSQMGFIVLLCDKSGKANIVHYSSKRCRRITRSVMAAELLSLVHGFDYAFLIRHALQELFATTIPIDAFVDSRTTFNCVAKHSSPLEKRLQIDVAALQESLSKGELRRIGWIPGTQNPADGLTKSSLLPSSHPLIQLMATNRLHITPEGWLDQVSESSKLPEKKKV